MHGQYCRQVAAVAVQYFGSWTICSGGTTWWMLLEIKVGHLNRLRLDFTDTVAHEFGEQGSILHFFYGNACIHAFIKCRETIR